MLDLGGQICSAVENTSAIFIEMGAVTLRNDNAFLTALCLQFKVNSHCKKPKQAASTTKPMRVGLCAEVSTVELIPLYI